MSHVYDFKVTIALSVGLLQDHWDDVVEYRFTVQLGEEVINNYLYALSAFKEVHFK